MYPLKNEVNVCKTKFGYKPVIPFIAVQTDKHEQQ